MRKSALSMLCVMAVASVNAAVHLPSFFSDQMVLQREKPIPIFGTATPGEHIQVTFLGDTIKGVSDEKGDWKIELPAAKAGGPFELMVEGENKIQLKDIWVGEVWLASGQSNMEWPLEYTEQAAEEIDAAHYPQIRQYKVPRLIEHSEQKDLQGQWDVCSPDTAGSFSGVGYYFAKELHQELDVPVGIIFTAYGGTDVEAWMPLDTLKEVPFMTKRIEDYKTWEASRSTGSPFREEMKTVKGWLKGVTRVVDPGNRNFFLGWAETDYDDSSWEKMALPTEWEPQGLAINGIV